MSREGHVHDPRSVAAVAWSRSDHADVVGRNWIPQSEAEMTPDGWNRLRRLFAESRTLDDESRRQFLDDACAGDSELRTELESLLEADREAESFLEVPAAERVLRADPVFEHSPIGRRFGAYKVLSEIGRGGMGVVYRAVRDDAAYQQEVALKLLPSGHEAEVFAERFRRERQILAGLEHPNIARLIDGGADDTGRPYYVMELVDGVPLDEYCGSRGLAIERRIELIRTVCSAVALAHSRLVVHCDLKPANVLVTADGAVKLLDFGIARLIAPDQQPGPATTGWWMTPEYASPERLRGEAVTTAADVYALGVMLYELLTGRRPHDLGAGSPEEVVRAICEQEPIRPSQVVARSGATPAGTKGEVPRLSPAGLPDANPRRLRRRLAGDLDTIALRALAIDPARRYGSVIQLADDLRRHLAGLPIRARPDRFAYRAGKFVGRHRAAVVAAVLAFVSLCGGLVATIQQARVARAERAVAERRFDEVRGLARTFIFEIHDDVAALPGSTAVRARIVEVGLEYLDRLEAEAAGNLDLQAELAAAYERIAAVQGGVGVANLGDREGAIRSQRRALALREVVATGMPSDVGARLALARAHSTLADLLGEAGDRVGRLHHAGEALSIRSAVRLQNPDDPAVRRAVASSQWDMAQLRVDDGDLVAGLTGFEAALETYRSLAHADGAVDGDRRNLALVCKKIGAVRSVTGDLDGARTGLEEALDLDETRLAASPAHPEIMLDVSFDHGDLGYVMLKMGRFREAVNHYEAAVSLRRQVSDADPEDVRARTVLSSGMARLAFALTDLAATPAATCADIRPAADRALTLWSELEAESPLDDANVAQRARMRGLAAACSGTPEARERAPGPMENDGELRRR